MKSYKVKKFANEAKKLKVPNEQLLETLSHFLNMEIEDRQKYSLGAGLYKLRLATNEGKGKSGGSRTVLAFQQDNRIIWLHLFAKNDKENITTSELKKLKLLADIFLSMPIEDILKLIKANELYEVIENV
jgi:hypothetical protein